MTPRIVLSLAVAALITTAGAVLAYRSTHVFVPRAGVGEKVLPGLAEKANDIARITVEQGVKKLELENAGGVWRAVATKYPLSPVKVKKVVISLINLEKLEAKTSSDEKYPLIEVDAPGKKGARGRRITLSGKDGGRIAGIIIGKVAVGKAGPGKDAQYVRVDGEKTSWLALGSVDATASIKSWVEPRFLKLDVDSVTGARIEHADGEIIEVRRTGKTATGSSLFELLNVPEGRKARTSTTIKFAATDWVILDLEDVRPAKADSKPLVTATITTDKGLKLVLRLAEEDSKGWISVHVAEKGKDIKAAGSLIARTKGWQFQIADYKLKQLEKRLEDLLEKKK